jgi:thiaminase
MTRSAVIALTALVASTAGVGADEGKGSAEATRFYWEAGRKVKAEFAEAYGKFRFPALRARKVAELARKAAEQLRDLDREEVDPEAVDHVNNVIRYYENLALNANKQGNKEAVQTAIRAYTDYLKDTNQTPPPAPADLSMSVVKLLTDNEPARAVQKLQADEQALLQKLRKKYGIELNPW